MKISVRTNPATWLMVLIFLITVASTVSAAEIIYVDIDAPPNGDGTSWTVAFKYLQDALAVADINDEIRVAEGTYIPDRSSVTPGGSGDREAVFYLDDGVSIMGGYAGLGDVDPDARNVTLYETILSADLDGDDDGFINNGENSYHVVYTREPAKLLCLTV